MSEPRGRKKTELGGRFGKQKKPKKRGGVRTRRKGCLFPKPKDGKGGTQQRPCPLEPKEISNAVSKEVRSVLGRSKEKKRWKKKVRGGSPNRENAESALEKKRKAPDKKVFSQPETT